MAPSSFGGLLATTCLQKGPQENILSQIPSNNDKAVDLETIDDVSMSNGAFDQPLMEAARNTMTLDLLAGTERGKGKNFQSKELWDLESLWRI